MIVLDTNVVSELMKGPRADATVLRWVRGLEEQPVTTVLTRAEILAGIEMLPEGRRRDELAARARKALSSIEMVLPVTEAAADGYADIVAMNRVQGRTIGAMDALIAAVARSVGATLATRNVRDFEHAGLAVVDPWSAGA